MKNLSLPKNFRLLKPAEFRKVYNNEKMVRSRAFTLFYLIGEEDKPARLGITVTKHFGKSFRRNRIKRLIREAYRQIHPSLSGGVDMVVNVRRMADGLSQKDVLNDLSSLFSKAGVKRAESD